MIDLTTPFILSLKLKLNSSIRKLTKHIKEIAKSLACYLKAQAILIFGSFVVCLIGLYIFKSDEYGYGRMDHRWCRCADSADNVLCIQQQGSGFA